MSDPIISDGKTDTEFLAEFGPYALVTGASSGIGQSFAEVLAAKGFNIILVARRRQRLEDLASRLRDAHGVTVEICETDLSSPHAPARILDATAALDVGLIVSNAGFGLKGEHAANDAVAMTDMLMVNCNVPMILAHGFIPRLRQRGKGGIILTSSVEGLMGTPYSAAYSASKAMVVALGEALWAELSPHGIKVLTLCPGPTDTEAAGLQGMDMKTMDHVMSPTEVADLTLANIENGPTYISSAHHRDLFGHILTLPRRDVLVGTAKSMQAALTLTK